jgi:hypothetical protein
MGDIKKVINDNLIVVPEWVKDKEGEEKLVDVQYQIERTRAYHASFLTF